MTASQNQKHPHHTVIIAYLEGKAIEHLEPSGNFWMLYTAENDYLITHTMPTFPKHLQFRIKPECVKIRLLRAHSTVITFTKNFSESEDRLATRTEARNLESFEEWLTDWIDMPQIKPLDKNQES